MAINKILGDMLASNLERSEDLAIETDLIYVDVANNRVGVKTNSPVTDFSIDGNASVSSLTPGRVVYTVGDSILSDDGLFTFDGTTLTVPELLVGTIDLGNLAVSGNTISATNTDGDVILSPNGLGNIILNGLTYPKSDGTNGQFLTTDGNGNLTFATVSQSFDIIADDSTADTINTGETIVFAGGEGIETSVEPNLIRISGQRATYTNRGIASFNSTRFSVNSGAVDIAIGGIGADQIAADAIDGTKIADDSIDSEHYVDGSIDNVHLANSSIGIGSDTVSLGDTITDINGLTSIDIDNITIDGNTISSTNANGDVVIAPDGVGVVELDTTSGMIIPVGTTGERRASPTQGEMRYNSTENQVEVFTGTDWTSVGAGTSAFDSETLTGDGVTVTFTLQQETSTDAVIVVIGGTLQSPGVAYSISGDQITFAEAPLSTDEVVIRYIAASSTVTGFYSPDTNNNVTITNSNFTVDFGGSNVVTVNNTVSAFATAVQFASMTTTQRNALTPSNGWVIYNTTDNKFQGYTNGIWVNFH
jgi:hypothetical protein